MAITGVGAAQATAASGVTTRALTRTAGAINNLLIVAMQVASGTAVPTISDTQGNTWVVANPNFQDAGHTSTQRSWYALAINTSSTTITVASNVAAAFMSMTLDEFTGTDTSAPLDQAVSTSGTGTPVSSSFTPSVNDELVWAYCVDSITAVGNIDGSAATKGGDDTFQDWSEYRVLTGRSGVAMTAAFVGSSTWDLLVATFKPPSGVATLEQEAYRFFNDDGPETTRTPKAAQDTSITMVPDVPFRLRMLVNATGDPPSARFKLQYRKVGAASWRDIDTTG